MKNITRLLSSILILALSCFFQFANAQAPAIEWQKTYGGSGDEDGGITKLSDGNYMEWGSTSSADGDFTENKGGYDAFLMKLDAAGNILWQKTYGGSGDEDFASVLELANGSFAIMGTTSSNDGDVTGNHGGNDVWLVKVNANGKLLSEHCFGGSGDDVAYDNCIVKMSGGAYIIAANTNSNDGEVSGNHGDYDDWLVKINRLGNIAWSKCIGGSGTDYVSGLIETNNHKLILAGGTTSNDGDVSGNHGGDYYGDALVVKLSQQGNVLWAKCYGGSDEELINNMVTTSDGNIALGGTTGSNDGDVSGNNGQYDMWIPKINSSTGIMMWQKCLGTAGVEGALGNMGSSDGGVVALGATSPDFDYVNWDAQVIKLDADGNEVWSKTFGGSSGEFAFISIETGDGGLLIQCNTDSYDGDVTNQHGPGDAWLVKLAPDGERFSDLSSTAKINFSLANYPNPFTQSTLITFQLPNEENVSLKIFDVAGRLVRTLMNDALSVGTHELTWDAQDENGNAVSAGVYFLNMETANQVETIQLNVVK